MKKIFLFAALASIVFASCQKEEPVTVSQNEGQQEITFSALSKAMTKGVLGSGDFAEDRTIQVAGVMKSGDKYVDFLEAKTFRKIAPATTWQGAKPGASAGTWEVDPVYYPIGGQNDDFRFLAYSETTPGGTDKTEATFARWYGSNEVELQVSDCAKNEIVYSGFIGNKTTTAGASATFARTQALVTVQIKAKEGSTTGQPKTDIIINKIGFKDVKTSGTLLLKYDNAASTVNKATAQWLYNAGCNCAFAEMGNFNLGGAHDADPWSVTADTSTPVDITFTDLNNTNGLGSKLSTTGYVLDRLFPAQKLETKKMVINYTLGDLTTDVELDLTGSNTTLVPDSPTTITWAAGKRYVYIITVNVNEILIAPQSLDPWDVTTITGQYDPDPVTP